MPTPKWRKQRITELKEKIETAKQQGQKEIPIKDLYAPLGLEHGLSFKTFLTYLKLLEDANLIQIEYNTAGQPEKVTVKEE